MNCQPESEHNHKNAAAHAAAYAEQQPMEVPDYLRLASFIRYQAPDAQRPDTIGQAPDAEGSAIYA